MSITNVLQRITNTASDVSRRAVDETKVVAQKVEAKATQVMHEASSFDPRPSSTPPPPPQHHSKAPTFRPSQLQASVGDGDSSSTGATHRTPKHADRTVREKFVPMSQADLRVLNAATSDRGLIGKAQVARAQQKVEALSTADRAQFQGLISGAKNDTEKVVLYKALASGHSVAEVAEFDKTIHGWMEVRQKEDLTLAGDREIGNGVMQQYGDTCAPTTAQALRGEYDPIYALSVRTAASNSDVSDADLDSPTAKNAALAQEQEALLTGLGKGTTTTRRQGTGGTRDSDATDAVVNSMSTYTGFRYASDRTGTTDQKLDKVAAQLQQGIATPIRVADATDNGHIVLATAVRGSGPKQEFLIHDPWSGRTNWITRKQFDENKFDIAGHNKVSTISVAFPQ
ncbi:MAG: hypothetical protein QM817_34655 [Archangium sp.]